MTVMTTTIVSMVSLRMANMRTVGRLKCVTIADLGLFANTKVCALRSHALPYLPYLLVIGGGCTYPLGSDVSLSFIICPIDTDGLSMDCVRVTL